MIVGGHPADAFDNAGGTLSHHAERGDRVTAVVMTHGVRSHDCELIDDLHTGRRTVSDATAQVVQGHAEQKREEVRQACAIMGITDVRFLEHEDDALSIPDELVFRLDEIIREVKPDIVITHHPAEAGGLFGAHAACARATLQAIHSAMVIRRGATRSPHRVVQIYFMGTPIAGAAADVLSASAGVFCPIFIDVTDAIEKKVRALDKLKSQLYPGQYARKCIEANEGHYGLFSGVSYAEPFVMYRPEVLRYLPLSDFLREHTQETVAERMAVHHRLITPDLPEVFE
jgi:LmbE family N-acetylglucosaminyl deacetylase